MELRNTTMASIKLIGSDGKEVSVSHDIATMSATIRNMLEDIPNADTAIPLPTISSEDISTLFAICEDIEKRKSEQANAIDVGKKKKTIPDKNSSIEHFWTAETKHEVFTVAAAELFLDVGGDVREGLCRSIAQYIKDHDIDTIIRQTGSFVKLSPEEEIKIDCLALVFSSLHPPKARATAPVDILESARLNLDAFLRS